jgi:hypothetical protein
MRSSPLVLGFLFLQLTVCADDFEFVVIGDTRPKFQSDSFRPFEALLERINELKPSLVVNLGDLIYGYGFPSKSKQWDRYEAVIKQFQVPYYQVPGNHDTHSRQARKLYGRRFGKFYQSFDYQDCHFVLLDNTEDQHWGYLGPAQLSWLKNDLKKTTAQSVFVFFHFPVWEPERITPEYYQFWAQTLHPLFKESRVRAVFAGHYHAYGPSREFDGIRYFISGGGGAELRPEYRKAGGQHHFMRVRVSGKSFQVSVVTERGEMSDAEADVMSGLQFAARNVSRIGLKHDAEELRAGTRFSVTVKNPYPEAMTGEASWLMDSTGFTVEPQMAKVQVPPGGKREYEFTLKVLRDITLLQSLPRLEFRVTAGDHRRKFYREIRFLQDLKVPYLAAPPKLDGDLAEWTRLEALQLGQSSNPTNELRACHDAQNLYLALTVPKFDEDEAKESGFVDELQVGFARLVSLNDFGGDFLRLGLNPKTGPAWDRTPGRKPDTSVPGTRSVCRVGKLTKTYEMVIPLRLLRSSRSVAGNRFVLDLSYPPGEEKPEIDTDPDPPRNTLSYRIRYGSDSLVPVYFVELSLDPK